MRLQGATLGREITVCEDSRNIFESANSNLIKFIHTGLLPEKTADVSRCHHVFPREMTSGKRVQKFLNDDASLLRSTILDKIKWNSKPPSPPPPQIKDEGARRAKTRHFPILNLGGRGGGGLGFPFILSKIVGSASD